MPAKAAVAPKPAAAKPAPLKARMMPAARPVAVAVHAAPRSAGPATPTRAPALPAFARAAMAEAKSAAPKPVTAQAPAPAAAPVVALVAHAAVPKLASPVTHAPAPAHAHAVAHKHAHAVAHAQAPAAAPKPKPAVLPSHQTHGAQGQPLAPHIQEAIEHSFHVDIAAVRVHTSPEAQRAARELSARAFTYGSDIFLGSGEHPSDLGLMAHETAHVVQQQSVASHQLWSADRGDRFEKEADRAAEAVQHGDSFTVSERVTTPRVQRLGISDALDYFADAAYNIPGYRMFTILLGVNPINMEHVDRSAANFLRAIIEFIPGGKLITQALDKYNVLDRVANWMQDQVDALSITGSSIKKAIFDFLDSLSWRDIFHLGSVWDRAKRIFTEPIDRIKDFVVGLLEGIWKFVREAILKPIAALATSIPGWDLLTAVMGTNPITGEKVPATAETVIGGFMKLIHEDEIWQNIQKANAIPRAMAWFKSVLSELWGFVSKIPSLFMEVLHSLDWTDIIDLPSGFRKIVIPFGTFLGQFGGWAFGKVIDLLILIFEVVKPSVLPYLKKVGAAFKNIIKHPIAFVRHLVDAAKLGLSQFIKRFPSHLKAGLLEWLTGSLPGVYIPKAFTLMEMGLFALSVLDISWSQIRAKIVKALGENGEKIMLGLEGTFDVVVALFKGGPAAAWEIIKDKLNNLKDMVIDSVVGLVTDTIIKVAVPKLIAMFIPGAGFISAILSIYDAIMVFVQKLAKIVETVKAFVDSIVLIAAGKIENAADRVEAALAGLLNLAISFLAGLFGLGGIAAKVRAVIEKVRGFIDKALDTAVGWVVGKAKAFLGTVKAGVGKAIDWFKKKKPFTTESGETHEVYFAGDEKNPQAMVASKDPQPVILKLEEFRRLASRAKAPAEQKQALGLITSTLAAVKKDPDSPQVVTGLRTLFEIYDPSGPPRKTDLAPAKTRQMGGSTVAIGMSIDWLNAEYEEKYPGSKPGSGQDELMEKLVTDPNKRSAFKYVRGHLLNENLGGKGEPYNLFPITGNANSQHLHSTESKIKTWVADGHWVFYEVTINVVAAELGFKGREITKNHVDSVLSCRAIRKSAKGEAKESFVSSIESTYKEKGEAERFDLLK
jgi:uncharacterized protein DUF4157